MLENGVTVEATPIKTLKDLLKWSVINVHPKLMGKPLSTFVKLKEDNEPKTLVCHDMRGNYLEDRFPLGCPVESVYYFTQWWYVDVFVYFSHHLVTIPPVGWIDAAHLHGVPVLGTFITEFDEGFKICDEFLGDRSVIDKICRLLADVALVYQFDGWLLNIENEIKKDGFQMDNLLYFVSRLTSLCKSKLGNRSLVIWYDSVTTEGELKWQNELNDLNKPFFDSCNGIFLNYAWKEKSLADTVAKAGNRLGDVYVGIDVYGRFGGGGFNSRVALEMIRKYHLSTAIFAPAWVFECLNPSNFEENQWNFWSLLAPFLHCSKIKSLPFETDFNPGKFYGRESFFFRLSDQNLQPHWFCSSHCCGGKSACNQSDTDPTMCPKTPSVVMRHLYRRDASGFVFCIRPCPDSEVVRSDPCSTSYHASDAMPITQWPCGGLCDTKVFFSFRLFCCDLDLSATKICVRLICSAKQPCDFQTIPIGILCTVSVTDHDSSRKHEPVCQFAYLPENGNKTPLRKILSKNHPQHSVELPLEIRMNESTKSIEITAIVPSKQNGRMRSIDVVFGEKQMFLCLLKFSVEKSA